MSEADTLVNRTDIPPLSPTSPKPSNRRRRRAQFNEKTRTKLKELINDRNNFTGFAAFTEDLFVIGIAVILVVYVSIWLLPLAWFVIGTRQRALATLLHEAAHLTLFKSYRLNVIVGSLAGWLVFQSFSRYKQSHLEEHHAHLGDEKLDPDTVNYLSQGLFDASPSDFIWRHLLPVGLGLRTHVNLRNLLKDRLIPGKPWAEFSRFERIEYPAFIAFWGVLLALSVWLGLLPWLFLLWFIPFLTAFQAVNMVIEWSEHFPLTRLFDVELEMTRNRRGSALEQFFFGVHGENWHLVHHLFPGIPLWNLAKAHAVMMEDAAYRAANSRSGGLLTKGPNGEPSIVSVLGEQLAQTKR